MDKWIEWNGGKPTADPAGLNKVEVKFRDGDTDIDWSVNYYWAHDNLSSDIVAYRVVES